MKRKKKSCNSPKCENILKEILILLFDQNERMFFKCAINTKKTEEFLKLLKICRGKIFSFAMESKIFHHHLTLSCQFWNIYIEKWLDWVVYVCILVNDCSLFYTVKANILDKNKFWKYRKMSDLQIECHPIIKATRLTYFPK